MHNWVVFDNSHYEGSKLEYCTLCYKFRKEGQIHTERI
jgi:ribosome-binding protein aMBF1 (putative translation factor)